MGNKYMSLFLSEPRFGMRFMLLCAVVFALTFSSKQFSWQLGSYTNAQKERSLISLIPAMEMDINELESGAARMNEAASDKDVVALISGIVIQGDSPIVLVGDNFLKEGDSIGQFIISQITEHKVVLKNKVTSLTKEITLD